MKYLIIAALGCLSFSVIAEDSANDSVSRSQVNQQVQSSQRLQQSMIRRTAQEDRTRSWLNLQVSNTQATSYQDSLSPKAALAAQTRAENSFSYPIPEKFIQLKFSE